QVNDITAESARYNIGGVNRNTNLPVLALAVFEADNRPWFSFTLRRRNDRDAVCDVEFREERRGTLIRTTGNESLPVHGRASVELATGRVLATSLEMESRKLKAWIDVTYGVEPALGILVPREMREKYTTDDGSTVTGRATYARFRRYKVTTDEK